MTVNVIGGVISDEEKKAYIDHAKQKYHGRTIESLDINVDGEFVNLKYTFAKVPFERIRRITGYLVGTTDRFNNAKRAEVRDRVKHSI